MENKIVKKIIILIIIAGSYYLLSLISLNTFAVGAEYGINFGGWVPMAAGLIFGPIAALASAVGGILLNIGESNIAVCIISGTISFVMAFLPYKLWHTIFCPRDGRPAYLESASTLFKYLLIALITAISVATLNIFENYVRGVEIIDYYSVRDEFLYSALQFYSTSLYIGILMFQILTGYCKITPLIPQRKYATRAREKRYIIDYILIGSLLILCIILCSAALSIGHEEFSVINYLFYTVVVVVLCLLVLPINRGGEVNEEKITLKLVFGVQKQVLTGASILILILVVLHMRDIGETIANAGYFEKSDLIRALFITARTSTVAVIIMAGTIYFVEKLITVPIKQVSDYAKSFVKNPENTQKRLEAKPVYNEVDELVVSVNEMTESIEKYTKELQKKAEEEARVAVEMETAAGIQRSLLPKIEGDILVDIAAQLIPARKVGGDFYDFISLGQGRYFIAVADVSGKGVSAALFMMRAISLMRANFGMSLSEMMNQLNTELSLNNDTMMFVTAFVGVVDLKTNTFTYVNAGHNPPVLYNNGKVEFIDSKPGFVLGPIAGTCYREIVVDISGEFQVLLYSDGITEAMNPQKELYGEVRLLAAIKGLLGESRNSKKVTEGLIELVDFFVKEEEQADDITILSLRVK